MANRGLVPRLCACGCGEYAAVDERRNRISKFMSGHNSRVSHPMAGRRHTPDSRTKIRLHRAGQTNVVGGGPERRAEIQRFLDRVVVLSQCWAWTGALTPSGYGAFGIGSSKDQTRRTVRAHRFSYNNYVGAVAEGMELDHLCRNRWCVNPEHLEVVSHTENIRRTWRPI